jgi:hypothetical protein
MKRRRQSRNLMEIDAAPYAPGAFMPAAVAVQLWPAKTLMLSTARSPAPPVSEIAPARWSSNS